MRIRRIQLAGLAAILAGGAASNAAADDLNITSATTAPVFTHNANNASAGDITVASGGSITITAGQTAITVDTNNDASVVGAVSSNNADNTTAIEILNGVQTNVSVTGSISLVEDNTLSDTDSDGDLEGQFAIGTNRTGILLDAGSMNGNINNGGAITIEGDDSAGMRLHGFVDGDGVSTGSVLNTGTINVSGDHSYGMLIEGGTAGDVVATGNISVRGLGATGLEIDGDVGGALQLSGTWSATGYLSTFVPLDQSHLEPLEDLLQGGSAVVVHADIDDGIILKGIGVEDDVDDNGDGVTDAQGDTTDNNTGTLRVFGSAPVIDISSNTTSGDIFIGNGTTLGFHNRGNIVGDALFNGFGSTGLSISGTATTSVDMGLGVTNDRLISATGHNGDAFAVYIGQNAIIPTFTNRLQITGASVSSTDQTAYAIYLASGANAQAINNSGYIVAQLSGDLGDAVAIYDASNNLDTITNSGSITATVVPFSGSGGQAIALDAHLATNDITLNQVPDTPFTDDDTVDDDVGFRPPVTIVGDLLFGIGSDHVNLHAGTVVGDISFNDGADTLTIDGGATYQGEISDSDGALVISVDDGLLELTGGNTEATSATFTDASELRIVLHGNPLDPPVLETSGGVTFTSGTRLTINVPSGLPDSDTEVFLVANGGLTGGSFVTGPVTGEGTPYLYNLSVALTNPLANDGDPNGLAATYALKTPGDLGFSHNQSNAFDAIIAALRTNSAAGDAVLAIDNAADFENAYDQLMPSYATGATELAATAIQQMQDATSNRLSATRLHDLHDSSVWGQEIAYGLTRDPLTTNGQEFRGSGFGFATGIDGPLDNGALFGLSVSFIASEVEEPRRRDGEIAASFGQANAYLGTAFGPIDLDFIAGLGAGKMKSRRFVTIGDSFDAHADADWWGYEGHGAIRASMPLSAGWLMITPEVALTYVGLEEQGYTESGGGTAIDYDVDSAFSQRLWADVGVEFAGRIHRRETVISPRLYLGYRANALNEGTERTYRFVSGGPQFTLTDEDVGQGAPLVGLGIDATNGYSTFSLSYEGEFGDQIQRHSLNAAVRFKF